jgi:hypothetical protein
VQRRISESKNAIALEVNKIDDQKPQDRCSDTEHKHVTDIVSGDACSRLRGRRHCRVRRVSLGFFVFGRRLVGLHLPYQPGSPGSRSQYPATMCSAPSTQHEAIDWASLGAVEQAPHV